MCSSDPSGCSVLSSSGGDLPIRRRPDGLIAGKPSNGRGLCHPWRRPEAGKPSGGCGLSSSSEGLKLASLPVIFGRPDGLTAASLQMDAAFRHRMRRFVIHGDGLKMQARREGLPDRRRFRHRTRPLSSSEGLKMASLPMDAAFRHPLAVIRRR